MAIRLRETSNTEMPQRQKILLIAVSAIFIVYIGDMAYQQLYSEPLGRLVADQETLGKRLQDAKLEVRRQQNKLRQLPELEKKSLPRELEVAVTEYRGWLLEMAEEIGINSVSVNAASATGNNNTLVRIPFLLRGNGTLTQVTLLLRNIYDADFLHGVQSISMSPGSDGRLALTMTVEAFVIPTATGSNLPAQRPHRELGEYRSIPRRNLFATGDPVAEKIVLSAITSDRDGNKQAWIRDPSGKIQYVAVGETIALETLALTVEKIDAQAVEVVSDGERRRIAIGQNLAASQRLVALP